MKRWKAIINIRHRFQFILDEWNAMRGILFRDKLGIGFWSLIKKKFAFRFNGGITTSFFSRLNILSKNIANNILGLDFAAKPRIKGKVKVGNKLTTVFSGKVKKQARLFYANNLATEFLSMLRTKKTMLFNNVTAIGATIKAKKRAPLKFDNRKKTIYTVTLLKSLTIGALKEKTVAQLKEEWRTIPQFKIEFDAQLKKKAV
jgi:hypothetical protein